MKPPLLLSALTACTLLAGAAQATGLDCPPPEPAAQQPRTSPSKGERQARKWFDMLDADGDGRISRAEARSAFLIKPSLKAWFDATDTDSDGYLTEQEVREAANRRRAERQRKRYEEALQECARRAQQQAVEGPKNVTADTATEQQAADSEPSRD